MRERILAVLGAIGLIVGAVFLRSALAGDDGSGGGTGGRSSNGDAAPVVACVPDLRSVCELLEAEGTITASAPLELAGAADPELEVDGWITWDPAPGVANFDLADAWVDVEPLASAPLGVLVDQGPGECGETSPWLACVVASAEQGVAVGVGTGTTAQSLARLHPIAGSLVPPDGGGFTTIDGSALRQVIETTQVRQSDYVRQINTFLTQRGALQLVVGPVPALEAAAARRGTASVAVPTPTADITIVIANHRSSDGDGPITAEQILGSDQVLQELERLGLEPGEGTVADDGRAGEVYAIRDKVS